MKNTQHKQGNKVRPYRYITPSEALAFKLAKETHGNGSAAIRHIYPEISNKGDRATRIKKVLENETATQYIDTALQQIGIASIDRLSELVESPDEQVALSSVKYAIDHIKGKATSKSITLTGKANVEDLLR